MSTIYLPSCKFTAYSPETSGKIKSYLTEKHGAKITGCCRPNHKKFTVEDTVLYVCNSCAAFTRESSLAKEVISIWEIIDKDDNFEFPDYQNKKMAIQDCWRVYDNLPQQLAIRSLLAKMNIGLEELDENFEKTRFCGTTLYENLPKQNGELAPKRFIENAGDFFHAHTEEDHIKLMKDHFENVEAEEVIAYCTGCLNGISLADKKPVHLAELVFGTFK